MAESEVNNPVARLGAAAISWIQELGNIAIFFGKSFFHIFTYPFQIIKVIQHIYFVGMKSVFVICLTGAFTGMVLGLQGYYTLVKFGSEGLLGAAVGLTLVKELGPVLCAIMITGRAGSAIAAEIGIMRISEQIDALETMDINPIRFLVSPRLAAAFISFPLLTSIFDVIGIFGGYLTGSLMLGTNPGIYFAHMENKVGMGDITEGLIKSIVFAAVVATICCYRGYSTHTRGEFGARGVSNSTTTAVVYSCVVILITDYIITSFMI